MTINPIQIGSEISNWCQQNDYTKEMLAIELGVTRQTLFNWTRNETGIPRVVALALCALELEQELRQAKLGKKFRKKSKMRE